MITTTFYFLRHGEVENPRQILYGRLPGFYLSLRGKKQIESLAGQLENKGITHLYSSPLERTMETADIIGAKLNLKPMISELIIEVKLFCEGITIQDYHGNIQTDLYNKKNLARGQESIKSIAARMKHFLNFALVRHRGTKTLVVSHGDPIMILKAELQGVPFTWNYKRDNYLGTGKYYTLEVSDRNYSWI